MIELKNVEIRYGDFVAVHDLNMTIQDGEFFTFLGPSGCGKTTTLRAIAGFEKISKGEIVAFGKNLAGLLPEERNIGFVFQNYALFPSMNVYENVAFGLKARKVPKNEIKARVEEIAEKTGITVHLQKKINELSGGQQQRVAIARAIVLKPKILLMDEPLSNLDAKLRVSTREEIRKLQKAFGITTIYVTHDQEEAMAISDRIAVFNVGRLEQIATPREIYNHPVNSAVAKFVGEINEISGKSVELFKKKIAIEPDEHFFVRPHYVRIGRNAQKENDIINVPGIVDSYEFLGSYTKINVRTEDGGKVVSVIFGERAEYNEGEKIFAQISPRDVLKLR